MPYEGDPNAPTGPTQLGGGLASSYYPLNAVQASGTEYGNYPGGPGANAPPANNEGGFGGSGGGFSTNQIPPEESSPTTAGTAFSPNNVYWTPSGINIYIAHSDPATGKTIYGWKNFGLDVTKAAQDAGIPLDVLNQIVETQKKDYIHNNTPAVATGADISYDPDTGNVQQALHGDPLSPNKVTGFKVIGNMGNGLKADYVVKPQTTNMTPLAPPAAPVAPNPMPTPSTNAFGMSSAGTGAWTSQGTTGASTSSNTAPDSDPTGGHGVPINGGTGSGLAVAGEGSGGPEGGGTMPTTPRPDTTPPATTNGPGAFNWGTQPGDAWTYGVLPEGAEAQIDALSASSGIPKDILRQTLKSQMTAAQDTLIRNDRQQRMTQSRFFTGVGRVNAGFTPIGF